MTKVVVTGLFSLRILLPVALITLPDAAQASILSVVSSLFTVQAATASANPDTNSQKMALLEAPVNANVQAQANSAQLVVDNSALVPVSAPDPDAQTIIQQDNTIKTYTVQAGDTVSEIAQKFSISSNTIIWANGLSRTAALKVGQTLVILPISGVQYKVQSGDTIQSVAKKYNGDANEIVSYNDITDGKLNVGDVIIIPDGEVAASAPSSSTTTTKPKTTNAPLLKGTIANIGVKVASADDSTTPTPTGASYYIRPIVGGEKTQGIHGNNAVDLAEACGTPIHASAAGTVIIANDDGAYNGGYGNYVVISHDNGSQTLYGHMSKMNVNVGDVVTQGQQIGAIGNTGKVSGVTGCHVHFEIRNGIRNPF